MNRDQQTVRVSRGAAKMVDEAARRLNRTGADLPLADAAPMPQPATEELARFYPVTVTKTGGSDGTASTRASWTYTITSIDGVELATAVAVVKTRPLGPMHYGDEIADPAYGLAFIDASGAWQLWDAGEVPNLTALSPLTAWQVDATSGEIQTKSRPILVPATGNETDWTKLDDTTESQTIECTEPGS